jgi:2-polyprenyl-3-methyl-5-hydroxy-6-metoxy-1,4-benzoquinol methylase
LRFLFSVCSVPSVLNLFFIQRKHLNTENTEESTEHTEDFERVPEVTRSIEIVISSSFESAKRLSSPGQKQIADTPTNAGRAPVPIARPEIHETVARILDPFPRGKLLDVPAGEGALSARLSEAGFQVQACDLYPEIFMVRNIDVRHGDLSATLPHADAEFQYITCLEGLEHIENPHQAIREFARLLTPGGHLVISVPNILNIEERVKWLLNGYTSHFKPISQEHLRMRHEQWGEKEEVVLHINPIAYTELRYILEKYGFEVLGTYRDKPKPNIWLYWPLAATIRIFGRLTSERKRRERWTTELASDEVLLGGNTLVLHATKRK